MGKAVLGTVLLAAGSILAACGATAPPDTQVVADAGPTTAAAGSARIEIAKVPTPERVRATYFPADRLDGEVDFRSHSAALTGASLPGTEGTVQAATILTPTAQYQTLDSFQRLQFPGRHWIVTDLPSAVILEPPIVRAFLALFPGTASVIDPVDFAGSLAPLVLRSEALQTSTIRSAQVTHHRVTLDVGRLDRQLLAEVRASGSAKALQAYTLVVRPLVLGMGGPQHQADLWLDGHGRLRRLSFVFPMPTFLPPPEPKSETVTVDFWDFGVPVAINVPSPSDAVTAAEVHNAPCPAGYTTKLTTSGRSCLSPGAPLAASNP